MQKHLCYASLTKKQEKLLTIKEKITQLQQELRKKNTQALIIPNMDPHQSEYLPDYWKIRDWYSGFTGSAGILVVTQKEALLWTDSRYFLQAALELEGSGIAFQKPRGSLSNSYGKWLIEQLPEGSQVVCNLETLSVVHHRFLSELLSQKKISLLHDTLAEDLYTDRPVPGAYPVFELDEVEESLSRKEKLTLIRREMAEKGQFHYLITALDDIAWTLNLRGQDIPFNPVFYAYLYIGPTSAILFVQQSQLSTSLTEKLKIDNINIRSYDAIGTWLDQFPEGEILLADPASLNSHLYGSLPAKQFQLESGIVEQLKCIKTDYEVQALSATMAADGAALVKAFYWLDSHPNRASLSEYDFAERLISSRREIPGYLSESFFPIVGFRENGAIVHYRPEISHAKKLEGDGLFLVDSGGQYLKGTTDITRTIVLGEANGLQREHFTRVLKGHIALASAVFPEGTTGLQLDSFARMYLWEAGLDFQHGTGHGVGFCLNVHEGPQGISPHPHRAKTIFRAGMLTSNEPGLYLTGEYGIRTENLILCKPSSQATGFLEFETLSLFPIDRNLIDEKMLCKKEKNWLNEYHEKVWQALHPLLNEQEKKWLQEKCRSIHS